MAASADALQCTGYVFRSLKVHHQIDAADINAEFQRAGGYHCRYFACFQKVFNSISCLPRDAAMMGQCQYFSGVSGQLMMQPVQFTRNFFGLGPHSRKNQGRFVGLNQFMEFAVNRLPDT